MELRVEVEGLREIEKALEELPKSQARGIARRAMKKAALPVQEIARDLVAVDEGELKESIVISDKLNPRQKRRNRREKDEVQMFVGAGTTYAHLVEFGTAHSAPQPFLRPAWESKKEEVLDNIKTELWNEIEKQVARNARRAAR